MVLAYTQRNTELDGVSGDGEYRQTEPCSHGGWTQHHFARRKRMLSHFSKWCLHPPQGIRISRWRRRRWRKMVKAITNSNRGLKLEEEDSRFLNDSLAILPRQ